MKHSKMKPVRNVDIDLRICGFGLSTLTFPVNVIFEQKGRKLIVITALAILPAHEYINKRLIYTDIETLINGMEYLLQ